MDIRFIDASREADLMKLVCKDKEEFAALLDSVKFLGPSDQLPYVRGKTNIVFNRGFIKDVIIRLDILSDFQITKLKLVAALWHDAKHGSYYLK